MRAPKISKQLTKAPARRGSRGTDLGLLALRLGAGGLMAGHGAQKLFGAFEGPGLEGMTGWLESMGLRPGKAWATLAGASEFGGGALIALGLGGPIGPLAVGGAMATATRRAHWGKPIWVSSGGAEVPILFSVAGAALALTGPGRYSLDRALGLRIRPAVSIAIAVGVAAGVALTESMAAKARAAQPAAEESAAPQPGDQDMPIETSPAMADAGPTENPAPTTEQMVVGEDDAATSAGPGMS